MYYINVFYCLPLPPVLNYSQNITVPNVTVIQVLWCTELYVCLMCLGYDLPLTANLNILFSGKYSSSIDKCTPSCGLIYRGIMPTFSHFSG